MPNAHQSTLLGAFNVNFARCSIEQDIFPGWKLSLLCSNRSREVPNNVKCSSTFLGALDKDCVSDCRGGMLLTIRVLQAQSRSIGHYFRYLARVFKLAEFYHSTIRQVNLLMPAWEKLSANNYFLKFEWFVAVWCNFRRRDICLVHIDNPFPPSAGKLYGWDQRAVSSWLRGFCITWNWHHHYFPVSLGISAQACSFEASIFPWTKGSSRFIKNLQWFDLKNWKPKKFKFFVSAFPFASFPTFKPLIKLRSSWLLVRWSETPGMTCAFLRPTPNLQPVSSN